MPITQSGKEMTLLDMHTQGQQNFCVVHNHPVYVFINTQAFLVTNTWNKNNTSRWLNIKLDLTIEMVESKFSKRWDGKYIKK